MSTPRTDAASADAHGMPIGSRSCYYVKTEFARQLELELTAALSRVKRLEEAGDRLAGTTPPSSDRYMAWIKAKEAKP